MAEAEKKTQIDLQSWLMDPRETTFWGPKELQEILTRQLDARLSEYIGAALLDLGRALEETERFQGMGALRFRELLFHREPPVEALALAKDYFKARREGIQTQSHQVATVLYFACVVAADRQGTRISRLDRKAILDGLAWVMDRPWVKGTLRDLIRDGRERLLREEAQKNR
jgi:hypothetical protein